MVVLPGEGTGWGCDAKGYIHKGPTTCNINTSSFKN